MTMMIEMKAEALAALSRQAASHGVDVQAYAARLLEDAVLPAGTRMLDADNLDVTLHELAQFSNKIPLLPDEAFSRESLYQDHD